MPPYDFVDMSISEIKGDATIRDIVAVVVDIIFSKQLIPGKRTWSHVYTFAHVMYEEGLSVEAYAKRLGVAKGSMSRNLLDLGEVNSQYGKGFNLIISRQMVADRRKHLSFLSNEGREVSRSVLAELVKRAVNAEPQRYK